MLHVRAAIIKKKRLFKRRSINVNHGTWIRSDSLLPVQRAHTKIHARFFCETMLTIVFVKGISVTAPFFILTLCYSVVSPLFFSFDVYHRMFFLASIKTTLHQRWFNKLRAVAFLQEMPTLAKIRCIIIHLKIIAKSSSFQRETTVWGNRLLDHGINLISRHFLYNIFYIYNFL